MEAKKKGKAKDKGAKKKDGAAAKTKSKEGKTKEKKAKKSSDDSPAAAAADGAAASATAAAAPAPPPAVAAPPPAIPATPIDPALVDQYRQKLQFLMDYMNSEVLPKREEIQVQKKVLDDRTSDIRSLKLQCDAPLLF